MICKDCGCINNNLIETSAEWRWYSHNDSLNQWISRCGLSTNELLPQSSWVLISYKYGESYEMKKLEQKHSYQAMP